MNYQDFLKFSAEMGVGPGSDVEGGTTGASGGGDAVSVTKFGVALDGTDQTANMATAWAYAIANGVTLSVPAGTLNCGTWRAAFTGLTNGFGLVGQGRGITTLKFADIPMTAGNNVEPALFSVGGTNDGPARNIRLEDFTLDYSLQTNKGGASLATISQTDVNPFGLSCVGIAFDKCLGIKISNIGMKEIYGDGVIGTDSPFSTVVNVHGENVSGGNPAGANVRGGMVNLSRCFGSRVRDCTGFNKRTYLTDTIGGATNITSKNTPCGNIAFGNKGQQSHNSTSEVPTWYTDQYLANTIAVNTANRANPETMGVTFENCYAWGYAFAGKTDEDCPSTFTNCLGLNCWVPFISVGSRGRFIGCHADSMLIDGAQFPQFAYENIKALYVQAVAAGQTEDMYAGAMWDGCRAYTRSTRVFVDSCGYGKFLNCQVIADSPTSVSLFETVADHTLYGTEVTGHVEIKGQNESGMTTMADIAHANIDLTISNLTNYSYSFFFKSIYGGAQGAKVRIRGKGPVGLASDNGLNNGELDFTVDCTDTSKVATADNSCWVGGTNVKVKLRFNVHTKYLPDATYWVAEMAEGHRVDAEFMVSDGGANTFSNGLLYLNGDGIYVERAVKTGDSKYNNPLFAIGPVKGFHVEEARNVGDTGALFNLFSQPNGPVTFGRKLRATNMWVGGTAPGTEPNGLAGLAQGIFYPDGLSLPYVKQVVSGKQGVQCIKAGYTCPAKWVASTAVTAGSQIHTAANVYTVKTAGTTSTTSPTATSGNITNGTAVLNYVGPMASFVEYGSLAAAALT